MTGRPAVVLDRTAFYPTSGGQPFDVGTLSDAKVLDVVDTDDGRILHVVDRAPAGPRVRGSIDWTRRFDHMQQHTGQHVLSAAFDRLLSARTESFHLGADYSTIDLDARAVCRPGSREARKKPIASCGRTGRFRSALPGRTRSRRFRCGRSPSATGPSG